MIELKRLDTECEVLYYVSKNSEESSCFFGKRTFYGYRVATTNATPHVRISGVCDVRLTMRFPHIPLRSQDAPGPLCRLRQWLIKGCQTHPGGPEVDPPLTGGLGNSDAIVSNKADNPRRGYFSPRLYFMAVSRYFEVGAASYISHDCSLITPTAGILSGNFTPDLTNARSSPPSYVVAHAISPSGFIRASK
ncbi:hypothetical protein J6590_044352 [Homalodisca vitripennis]|nr:hypothetical protein J6590_044352 [Homalodisca vitripennis]